MSFSVSRSKSRMFCLCFRFLGVFSGGGSGDLLAQNLSIEKVNDQFTGTEETRRMRSTFYFVTFVLRIL